MSLGLASRLRHPKKQELLKSHSQSHILANKLQQDGVMSTVENVMQAVDQVAGFLGAKCSDPKVSYKESIVNLCQHLKVYGPYLELLYQDQLNRAFVVFRNSSQDNERLDYLSRLHLLELIELRAKNWKGNEVMSQYYKAKINQCNQMEALESTSSIHDSIASIGASPILTSGEILKSSGKFVKPTRIPGKNYCKDEVVIRNADSGKVMGIKGRRVHMIEELSETIISFQRVSPGAKERLVQITGASEESINHAKQLIEETIRRNASPIREQGVATSGLLTGSSSSINSSASEDSALPHSARASRTLLHSLSTNDASIGEFKYTVVVGSRSIKISGDNLDLVRTSKLVLDEYFSSEPLPELGQLFGFDSLPQPVVSQDLTESPLSPPESLPSPELINGQTDDSPAPLRRPRLSIDEIMLGKPLPNDYNSILINYSIEHLARLAMSPLCLIHPEGWESISQDNPNLIRKQVEVFDCKQYLTNRSESSNLNIIEQDIESEEV